MILNAYQELLNKTYSLVDEAQIARISIYRIRRSVCSCAELEVPVWQQER